MSLFKTNPEIFCNGKFRFRSAGGNAFDLVGVSNKQYYPEDRCLLCYNFSGQIIEKDVSECTLIARPIESMTDEEVIEIIPDAEGDEDYAKSRITDLLGGPQVPVSIFLYLLSIGCYPGPQSDFDNGNVIVREG